MYKDYAINRELFHWESQSRQHSASPPSGARSSTMPRHECSAVRSREEDLRARHPGLDVPRFGEIRRSRGCEAGRVHVAARGADAGGALRGRPERRGGVGRAADRGSAGSSDVKPRLWPAPSARRSARPQRRLLQPCILGMTWAYCFSVKTGDSWPRRSLMTSTGAPDLSARGRVRHSKTCGRSRNEVVEQIGERG
jgi:hypothetical protein